MKHPLIALVALAIGAGNLKADDLEELERRVSDLEEQLEEQARGPESAATARERERRVAKAAADKAEQEARAKAMLKSPEEETFELMERVRRELFGK